MRPGAAGCARVSGPPTTTEEVEMLLRRLSPVLVMILVLASPLVATAQDEPTPLTWVGMVDVKPGTGPGFEKVFETYQKPLLDQLIADGKAMSWGLGYELAGPGGYDYVVWVTMADWSSMGAVEAAFDARYEGLSEDELQEMIEDFTSVIDPANDEGQLLRHKVFKGNPEGTYNYLYLSAFTVKTGHESDVMKMYKSFMMPINDRLLEKGVITGYGMIVQEVHTDPSFTHEAWFTFESLSDLDTRDAVFEEEWMGLSEGDGVARDLAFMKFTRPEAHFDRLIRVTMKSE
jgi:hypothetical protein